VVACLQKEEINGNRGQIEKCTKVDAELGLWGWRGYWFVCYRRGGWKLNNAHTNYILPTVSVNVKKMALYNECKSTFQFSNLTKYGHGPPEDGFKGDRNM